MYLYKSLNEFIFRQMGFFMRKCLYSFSLEINLKDLLLFYVFVEKFISDWLLIDYTRII